MDKIKLIFAGSRNFTNTQVAVDVINYCEQINLLTTDQLEFVSGMAKGADTLGRKLAMANGLPCTDFPADWQDMSEPCVVKRNARGVVYNALAGMARNKQMGNYSDMAIVMWNGRSKGSLDMINFMKRLGKLVIVYEYKEVDDLFSADNISIYYGHDLRVNKEESDRLHSLAKEALRRV